MENENSSTGVALPEHLQDLIEISEIDGSFRDFVEKYLFHPHCHFPCYRIGDKQLLRALNKAKSVTGTCETETLSLQVLKFIEVVELPLDQFDVHGTVKRIGEFYWKDRALEFFEFLVCHGNYPIERWRSILWDYENARWNSFFNRDRAEIKNSKRAEDHIAEGLIRHSQENPSEDSPYSLCFWFNIELWKSEPKRPGASVTETKNKETGEWETDEGEDISTPPWDSAQYPESKRIFNIVLRTWADAILEANNEEAIYAFLDWAEIHNIKDQLEETQLESIRKKIQGRPIQQPLYPLALKDIKMSIRALNRNLWSNGDAVFTPSDDLHKNLQDQLGHIAELCAEDRLKAKLPLEILDAFILRVNKIRNEYTPDLSLTDQTQDALAIKLFALMRSCIQHTPQTLDIYDYQYAMRLLVRAEQEGAVLRQLMMTLRTCPQPCSCESLNFRPKREINGYILNVNFNGLSPEYCISGLIDLLLGSWQVKDRLRELCMDQADYLISRLKFRKQKGRTRSTSKFSGSYDEKKCVEANPIWRKAYAEALGELGYSLDGKVLHLLDFVRKHDPDESVREAAHSSYRLIHREQTKELDDYKSLRAAFLILRKAQREALGFKVNEAHANLLRRQELRGESQTNVSLIYLGYLDLY